MPTHITHTDSMPTQIAQMEMDQPVELIRPLQEEQERGNSEVMDVVEEVQHSESAAPPAAGAATAAAATASLPPSAEETGAESGSENKQDSTRQDSLTQDPESAIKLLVPNFLAGSLIGKKGATIKDVQLKASCMVRIATSGMYYPGTMERAVLVAGETDGVKKACGLILHTLHVPDNNESGCAKLVSQEKADTVEVTQRLLIPLTAGGLVIGRKGANIAALLEASGAKVTLGQKADVKVNERLVTVQGKLTAATKAVEMLVDKLMEEPVLSRFANLSVNYRGHGSSHSKAAIAAGIVPAPLPYQRVLRGSSPPPKTASDGRAGTDSAPAATVTTAEPTTAPATAPAAAVPVAAALSPRATPVAGSSSVSSSPATSVAGRRVTSPPRLPSPARATRGTRSFGRVAERGFESGNVRSGGFQPQQFRQQPMHQQQQHRQQSYRQPPRPRQQQQHQQHRNHQQGLYFHQQPQPQHQHQQRLSMSPARLTPPSPPTPTPHVHLPQQQSQPGSMMSLAMGPGGPMLPSPLQMGPMGQVSHPPATMYAMSYAPPAGTMYHHGGVQTAPSMPGPFSAVGGDGHPRGYPTMPVPPQQQQQQQQQGMFPIEHMTNPVAAAIAASQPTTTVTVGVPNHMIGAILGPGGAIISELQSLSGARINVSQRDAFMPGTENRILTITGAPLATQTAQYLVSQKIEAFQERPRRW